MSVFSDVLGKKAGKAERPKPFPVGSYEAVVLSFENHESRQKKTPGVRFVCRMTSPMEDVDTDEYEGEDMAAALAKKTFNHDLWITENALWMLDQFLGEHLGLDLEAAESYEEVLAECQGCTFGAYLSQSPSQKAGDESIFNNIDSTFAL